MIIRKAERRNAKLRLALCGVSGSGKTMSAIKIAAGMGGKAVCIDTENGSADLYCDIAEYDVLPLSAPFSSERYIQAIKMCEKEGYDTIIIDSLSHAWSGPGGILDRKSKSTNKNDYAAWGEVTPLHNNMFQAILDSKCHIIACMRSKAQYEVSENSRGKMAPTRIGLAPVQRADTEHEFTVALDIDRDTHFYNVMKDRTYPSLFEGKSELITEAIGESLIEWLNNGKPRDEIVKEHCDNIKGCSSLSDLKSAYMSAYSDNLLSDEMDKITKIKDEMKKKIEEKEFEDDTVDLK